jgi:hypothetical protein
MKIYFTPSPDYAGHGREHVQGDELDAVSRADLRWYYFLGRLGISDSMREIGPSWGWVPLFDAMCCVRQVMVFAQGGDGLGKIDFTENDEFIDFQRTQKGLRLVPTYSKFELECTIGELVTAGGSFIREEVKRVIDEYPSLARNEYVRSLALDVGLNLEVPEV